MFLGCEVACYTSPTKLWVEDLQVYLLWRNDAYNYWVTEWPVLGPIGNYSSPSKDVVFVKAGYLIRTMDLINNQLLLTGDVNATTEIEVISTPATRLKGITLNGEVLQTSTTSNGNVWGAVRYNPPKLDIPDLSNLEWKFIDSLTESQVSYDDSVWTPCILDSTNNPRQLDTPNTLYSMGYGYHTRSLLYRGHFNSNSREPNVWLNDTFLGSWVGSSAISTLVHNMSLSSVLPQGSPYVSSVLICSHGPR
jgi:beta-galactosidase